MSRAMMSWRNVQLRCLHYLLSLLCFYCLLYGQGSAPPIACTATGGE
jgi:hypothetical protein